MLFVVRNIDKPNSGKLRADTRQAHLEYLDKIAGVLKLAGPFLADDGETMNGSLWIVEAKDKAEATRLAEGDPYAKVGLFESQTVTPFRRARGVELG
jgi:uncharacterized protein YciI